VFTHELVPIGSWPAADRAVRIALSLGKALGAEIRHLDKFAAGRTLSIVYRTVLLHSCKLQERARS
jgi:hypothetical protein